MSSRERLLRWLAPLLVAATLLAVFRPVTGFEFVPHDDPVHIYENRRVTEQSLDNLLYFWRQPHEGLYMPLTYSLWMLQARLAQVEEQPGQVLQSFSKFDAGVFHSFSLGTHILNALLVYAILLMLTGHGLASGAGALLFGLHPVQVESVAWISEFKGLAAAFFTLAALAAFLASCRRRSRAWYVLSTALYILALLSKPSSVVAPFLAFLLARWGLGQGSRRLALALLPWVLLAIPLAILTSSLQAGRVPVPPLHLRPIIFLDALGFYLWNVFWPLGLCIDYGRIPAKVLGGSQVYLTATAGAVSLILAWLTRRVRPWPGLPLLLFCAAFLPVSGLLPFAHQRISTVADRYLYLPMLGTALAVAYASARLNWKSGLAAVAVLAVLVVPARDQVQLWKRYEPLYYNVIRVNPQSFTAHTAVAEIAQFQGRPEDALRHYRLALRINPEHAPAHLGLGTLLLRTGHQGEAVAEFLLCVRLQPDISEAWLGLGEALEGLGHGREAVVIYEQALQHHPGREDIRNRLTKAMEGMPK